MNYNKQLVDPILSEKVKKYFIEEYKAPVYLSYIDLELNAIFSTNIVYNKIIYKINIYIPIFNNVYKSLVKTNHEKTYIFPSDSYDFITVEHEEML